MATIPRTLLVATYNEGKSKEIRSMLSGTGIEVVCLNDIGSVAEIEETGSTFEENARLKACGYAKATGLPTMCDDSGLEVAALGGAPGVLSARWAGEGATDSERMEKLLSELRNSSAPTREARFVCAMAFADESGMLRFSAEGICRGTIAETPIGKKGFGYDPIFMPEGFSETFGELAAEVKDEISHRRQAVEKIIPFLLDFFGISA